MLTRPTYLCSVRVDAKLRRDRAPGLARHRSAGRRAEAGPRRNRRRGTATRAPHRTRRRGEWAHRCPRPVPPPRATPAARRPRPPLRRPDGEEQGPAAVVCGHADPPTVAGPRVTRATLRQPLRRYPGERPPACRAATAISSCATMASYPKTCNRWD